MSTLYVVATPIGNLKDLTARAAEVLRSVQVVVAEDTRVTSKLLAQLHARPKLISYHRRSGKRTVNDILTHLERGDVALVSDAGTPGINDPGQTLIAVSIAHGHRVAPIPGPSSIVAALSVSGFYVDRFTSHGFLSANRGRRRSTLKQIAAEKTASLFFETPHRIRATLEDMSELFADRSLVICRELTKLHEEIWRGTASEALDYFTAPRGEFVIVIAPSERTQSASELHNISEMQEAILEVASDLSDEHRSRRDLVDAVVECTGFPKRMVYQTLHKR